MKSRLLATCAVCAYALVSHGAIAQTTQQSTPVTPATPEAPAAQAQAMAPNPLAAPEAGLADIIVTAQRRSENLQKAAVAISAVSGDALVSAGVVKPADLTSIVPALQIAPSAGSYSVFYLRGVGTLGGTAFTDAAVSFNFNGVFIGRASGTNGFFYDVERVEVLKGPQGTLYGRNATGGAINVLAKRPQLGTLGGSATLEYGNYDALRLEGVLNVPIGDKVAVRAAVNRTRHDGYMNGGTDDQNDLGGRISVRAEPTDTLSINIVADAFRQRGVGPGGIAIESGVEDRNGYQSAEGTAFVTKQPNLLLGRTFAPYSTQSFLRNSFWGISGTVDWKTPVGTVTIVPGYRESKLRSLSSAVGFYIGPREQDRQTSLEVRLASDDNRPIRYLLGGFFYRETNDVPQFYVNQQSNVVNQVYRLTNKNGAAFGRLTWAITPELRVGVGGRYTSEHKTLDGTQQSLLKVCVRPTTYFPTYVPGCPTASVFPVNFAVPTPNFDPTIDGTITVPNFINKTGANAQGRTFNKFTYRVGADWDITPRNLLYASYETGFKSGGFYLTADSGIYQPENIASYTIGSKNRFFDNKLQFNLELFYWKYKDQQISHFIQDSSGSTQLGTENVGQADYKGIEIEARYLLTRTTEFNADVQYLDAKYKSFVYRVPNQNGGQGNGTACASTSISALSYTVDCSGKRPPYAPTWTLNLGVQQTVDMSNGGQIVGGVRSHFQTRTLTGLEFTEVQVQGAYWQADAQVGYTFPNKRITVTAYANNIFDKTVFTSAFPAPFGLFNSALLRPPQTYGVRLAAKF